MSNNELILKRLIDFMNDPRGDQTKLRAILESGYMDGFFTTDEVNIIFGYLSSKYQKNVATKVIGKSFKGRDIKAYYIHQSPIRKSKVLFTGVHHARELITANMVVKIFLETLHSLIHDNGQVRFWNFCDLIIVPIVNIDGHQFISESFGTPEWQTKKEKRKNMNDNYCR